jgi:hypothetical protein
MRNVAYLEDGVPVDVSAEKPLPVVSGVITAAPVVNALTVPASAEIEIKADTTALAGRKVLILYPPSAGTIYWGATGVTSLTGAPLASTGIPVTFELDPDTPVAIYAIGDGTERNCRVVEAK